MTARQYGRPFRPKRVHSCLGNDPTCPGHDGDACHYQALAVDLAAAFDTTAVKAMHAMRQALEQPEPIRSVGIVVDYRWYERPRWLWRRPATNRTARWLTEYSGQVAP